MVYQPPTGARDLLPLEVAQKGWIDDRLQQVFHRWGYHRIITSTLERLETLMAGGAIDRSTVIQLQQLETEQILGLRPELTASIARTAVTRMADSVFPQRLCYNANVFRRAQEGSHSRQQEFYQTGVELLGGGGLLADAEILLLLINGLEHLGLGSSWHLVLAESGLTRSLLSPFPDDLRPAVRSAIARLDRVKLETLPLSQDLRDRAFALLNLRGDFSEVLQRVNQWMLNPEQKAKVDHLQALMGLLQASLATDRLPIVLDLSVIRNFDYYTGIVFEVVIQSNNGPISVGQGGRYDQLFGLYHPQQQALPGIGFSLQLEDLHQVLLATHQLPRNLAGSDWLVVSESLKTHGLAFAHAQHLRDAGENIQVEMDLSGHGAEQIRSDARQRRIRQIAWLQADGSVVVESPAD